MSDIEYYLKLQLENYRAEIERLRREVQDLQDRLVAEKTVAECALAGWDFARAELDDYLEGKR